MIALVAANLFTLAALWYGNRRPQEAPSPEPGRPGGPALFIERELALDAGQKAEYARLRADHQQAVAAITADLKTAKDHLFSMLGQDTAAAPSGEAVSLATRIGELNRDLDLTTYAHFKALRKLCSPAQQRKFDEIIRQVMHEMGRPPAGHREGGPPQHAYPPPPERGFPPPPGR